MGRSEPKEEPTHCSRCGSPLLRLKWSSSTDVLVCDVSACERYRRPIPVPRRDMTLAEELAPLVRRTLRGSGRKPKVIPEEDFRDYEEEPNPVLEDLRRMRREISSKEEDSEVL